jgi:hypothetical protein
MLSQVGPKKSKAVTFLEIILFVFSLIILEGNTNKIISKKVTAFDFFGPTCDSMDYF